MDVLITHDEADALLRDPQTPDDVRAYVRTVYGVQTYLNRVEFVTDSDGIVNVQPRQESTPEPAPAESSLPASPESGSSTQEPVSGSESQ